MTADLAHISRVAAMTVTGAVPIEITADGIRLRDDVACPPPMESAMATDTRAPVSEDEIDEAAVLRAIDGDTTVALNSDEVLEVIDRLHDRGMTDREIADRIAVSDTSVNQWRLGRSRPLGLAANRLTKPPATPRPGPRPLASVPTPPGSASAPTVDTLAAAAARSTSKRTQALGVKLNDLAGVLRQRLNDEREQAEKAERDRAVREAATAEVARLEAALAEARAKAGLGKRKTRTTSDRPKKPLSEKQLANLAAMRAAQGNTDPCANGCGFVAKTKSGKGSHERNCGGAA